jgi:hypothetical protein
MSNKNTLYKQLRSTSTVISQILSPVQQNHSTSELDWTDNNVNPLLSGKTLVNAGWVVMTHVTYVQEEIIFNITKSKLIVNNLLNFVKYVLVVTNNDLTADIDANKIYRDFQKFNKVKPVE